MRDVNLIIEELAEAAVCADMSQDEVTDLVRQAIWEVECRDAPEFGS